MARIRIRVFVLSISRLIALRNTATEVDKAKTKLSSFDISQSKPTTPRTHTWKGEIDHSDCPMDTDFNAGIINYVNSETLILKGHVKKGSEETVNFTLNVEGKELQVKPSWKCKVKLKKLNLWSRSMRECPYFWSDCDECKSTVTRSDDWRFVKYKKDGRW